MAIITPRGPIDDEVAQAVITLAKLPLDHPAFPAKYLELTRLIEDDLQLIDMSALV